jgi:RNA polymerase sigma-54 factor
MDLPEATRIIGKDIIYNIDDDGFLKTPLADIAGTNGVALEAAEKVLGIIKKLDPPGMGSRNLAEYLLMQLSEDDHNFELKRLLITQHFDQLQEYKLPNLAKSVDKSLEEIQKAAEEIKLLKPHPAAGFSSENIPYIFPDVIITKIEDNYEIKVQSEAFPSLVISQYYRQLMAEKNTDKPTRAFVRDKINDAAGLIQAILLRGSLLRQVAEQIVLIQRDFLDKGIEHLKPLMMKDIAKDLGAHGVHLSTVSRILANKYVQTPHGLYSMKFFFSSTSETAQGNVYAQPAMISAIKEIVEKEDKDHPLSDIRIAEALKGKNFTVSRRTIAKYRETLNIPNHNQRKKSE